MRSHRVCAVFVFAAALIGFALPVQAAVLINIDKTTQRMTVMVDGELRWSWPVSTGRARHDTPSGRFTAFRMEEDHYSREWDDAPMPHSIFFTRVGHAIHGTDQHRRLGQPASHGCVRLSREHAAELFALVKKHGMPNTNVTIDGEISAPPPLAVARRPQVADEAYTASIRRDRIPREDGAPTRASREPQQRAVGERPRRVRRDPPREDPPQRVARAYAPPPRTYSRSESAERPRVHQPRHSYVAPAVRYDPRVEIIEEAYVNGHWVRRRYYRHARPQDLERWR